MEKPTFTTGIPQNGEGLQPKVESNPLSKPVAEQLKTVFGIDDYQTSKEVEEEIHQTAVAIGQFLQTKLIPKTYHLGSNYEGAEETMKILKSGRIPGYMAKNTKNYSLFGLGSLFLGHRIDKENVETELRKAFSGKKVLVLGDDVGGLSEIINLLGGTAYGLEYYKPKVNIARSGVLAESGEPQTQVIEGNILDLTDSDSELLGKLKQLGPFDAVYSYAVFNSGSGIEDARNPYYERNSGKKDMNFMGKILDNTDQIMNDQAIQFHESIDGGNAEFLTSRRPLREQKDILDQFGLEFRTRGRHLLTKKGLMKKLIDADPSAVVQERRW